METVLVRVNLDIEEKDFWNTLRFHTAASLLKSLTGSSGKLVVLSHRGRPRRRERELGFQSFVPRLEKKIGKGIIFFREHDFKKIRRAIDNAPGGSIFLLENLRFLPGETRNSTQLGKQLASLGDRFINNDFATAHHPGASFVAITEFVPSSAGELLKNEVQTLTKVRERPRKPFVIIVGGAKVEDKVSVIDNLLSKADWVLLGGGAANTITKARGENIGDSLYEPHMMKEAKRLAKHRKIVSPPDHAREGNTILDIGPAARKHYAEIIAGAKTIVWAGPMGYFEKEKFAKGTRAVAKAVLGNKQAVTVIGGAETVYSLPIKTTKQKQGNVFLSTGGGAMLHFLAGEKLPALAALEKGKPRQRREALKK